MDDLSAIKRSNMWLLKGKIPLSRLLKSEVMISSWLWIVLILLFIVIVIGVYFLLRRWQSTSDFQKVKLTNARVDEVLGGIDFVRSASLDDEDSEVDDEHQHISKRDPITGISMQKVGQNDLDIL
jgi:hypothetical protein